MRTMEPMARNRNGLNPLRFNTAQDPIRLARMVNEMRLATEEAACPIETTACAPCFRSCPPSARGGWGCRACRGLFLAHHLCSPIRASRMGSWRYCPGLLNVHRRDRVFRQCRLRNAMLRARVHKNVPHTLVSRSKYRCNHQRTVNPISASRSMVDPPGPYSDSITTSRSPVSTRRPGWTRTSRILPSRSAVIVVSIFMASSVNSF